MFSFVLANYTILQWHPYVTCKLCKLFSFTDELNFFFVGLGGSWLILLVFDIIIFVMTLVKSLAVGAHKNRTVISVLFRDGE